MTSSQRIVVFLFAHQDDEIGVFYEIERTVSRGDIPICIYLTNGARDRHKSEKRCKESVRALKILGVPSGNAYFLGAENNVPDGQLHLHMSGTYSKLKALLAQLHVCYIVMHAFEGGHQDHDATFAIGLRLAKEFNVIERSLQFALYRSSCHGLLPYVVFRPLTENGLVRRFPIPFMRRLAYLWLLLNYKSQWKTMLGLAPFIFFDYLTDGAQKLQPVGLHQVDASGHRNCLYERRGHTSRIEMMCSIRSFLSDKEVGAVLEQRE